MVKCQNCENLIAIFINNDNCQKRKEKVLTCLSARFSVHCPSQLVLHTLTAMPYTNNREDSRKNAKPTTITKIVYVHEDMAMKDMIVKVLDNIKRRDLLGTS
jgi:hypothetical protein